MLQASDSQKKIQRVWVPDRKRAEADRLRISADAQYLKVVVEDDLGVEIELDQRSEGFQWLVSFFIVFFAETADKHENAILLLDEPGLSLHGLKQREFRIYRFPTCQIQSNSIHHAFAISRRSGGTGSRPRPRNDRSQRRNQGSYSGDGERSGGAVTPSRGAWIRPCAEPVFSAAEPSG